MNTSQLLSSFIDFGRGERQLAHQTLISYRSDLKQFARFCDKDVHTITLDDLRAWNRDMQARNLSRASVNRKVHALVTFWEYLMIEGLSTECLPRKLSKTLPKRARPHNTAYLSVDELKRFVGTPTNSLRDRVAWSLLAWLGLRRGELLGLKVGDVDHIHALIQIINGKGGLSRTLPVPKTIRADLKSLCAGRASTEPLFRNAYNERAWTKDALYKSFKQHCRNGGLDPSVTPHVLRHSFATHLAMRGVPLEQIKTLMGHRDLKTTQMYIHYSQQHLDSVLDRHPLGDL